MTLYKNVIRPILFQFDPEAAHHIGISLEHLLKIPGAYELTRNLVCHEDPRLQVTACGITFKNPLGLAAGFDKNARAMRLFSAMGFGHLEIGSVVGEPQEGNPRPRIFRFPKDEALINRMRFPSVGLEQFVKNLDRNLSLKNLPKIGVSIAKTHSVPFENAIKDLTKTFAAIVNHCAYVSVDVSCPAAEGLREQQTKEWLGQLFPELQKSNPREVPVFVKISPTLSWAEIDGVIECALKHKISGIIATNTSLGRERLSTPTSEAGGLSGKPNFPRTIEITRYIQKHANGKLVIVSVGGVRSASDVVQVMTAGASLVQIYTAIVYEGPFLIRNILRKLSEWMKAQSIENIQDIVGQGSIVSTSGLE